MKTLRPSGEVVALILFLLLLAGASAWIGARTTPPADRKERRTVRSYHPDGWRGLYLLLRERKIPVGAIERKAGRWPKTSRVIVTGPEYFRPENLAQDISPPGLWTEKEASAARRWIAAGGTLVLLSSEESALTRAIGLRSATSEKKNGRGAPVGNLPALRGVRRLVFPEGTFWTRLPASSVALAKQSGQTAAAAIPHGRGRILAVSSAGIADNEHLSEADNARFLTALIEMSAAGRPVLFDEYRQGFEREPGLLEYVGWPGRAILWQLVGVALLATWSVGRRFGLPRPPAPVSRVSSEYVTSLANLWRQARASDVVVERLRDQFRHDLRRATGLSAGADDDVLAARAASRLGRSAGEIKRRLGDMLAASQSPQSEAVWNEKALVALAQEMEALRKELGIDPRRG